MGRSTADLNAGVNQSEGSNDVDDKKIQNASVSNETLSTKFGHLFDLDPSDSFVYTFDKNVLADSKVCLWGPVHGKAVRFSVFSYVKVKSTFCRQIQIVKIYIFFYFITIYSISFFLLFFLIFLSNCSCLWQESKVYS